MPYMSNANYILFSHVVSDRIFGALERLCAYRNYPTHSLDEHIHLIYDKLWTFHRSIVRILGCQWKNR